MALSEAQVLELQQSLEIHLEEVPHKNERFVLDPYDDTRYIVCPECADILYKLRNRKKLPEKPVKTDINPASAQRHSFGADNGDDYESSESAWLKH